MPSYNKYLYNGISINLTLYYLITTLAPVISISIVLTILISLFRYLFNNSYASTLSKKRTKIVFLSNTIF